MLCKGLDKANNAKHDHTSFLAIRRQEGKGLLVRVKSKHFLLLILFLKTIMKLLFLLRPARLLRKFIGVCFANELVF